MFRNEKQIKKDIMKRAIAMATDAYEKDVLFKSLQASDLHYAIIEDMIKAANMTGKVTIKLKDGSEIVIEGKDDREELNQLKDSLY